MSYYHKYNFVSVEPIYAIVREELKSYFDTGAADDLLFPTYVNKCLGKLGKATHAIVPVILFIEDFTCRLPDNFHAVREAWVCAQTGGGTYTSPESFYSQACDISTIQLSPKTTDRVSCCDSPSCNTPNCGGECMPEVIQAVYKTQKNIHRSMISRQFLLKPGNISFIDGCQYGYNEMDEYYGSNISSASPHSASCDSFDLRDNKFVTTFRRGIVELVMYAEDFDCLGNQMIPDNYRIKEYIELFLKYKTFETLCNQSNDESFNQLQLKKNEAKMLADEAYILAESEIKKQDIHTKVRRIKRIKNKFNRYELSGGRSSRRRRNY